MAQRNKKKNDKSLKPQTPRFPWRNDKNKWTDTLLDKRLLDNPSLMTNHELAGAIKEHQDWRRGMGKYDWVEDPDREGKEQQPPFSNIVLTRLVYEVIARLTIIGDISSGRFKGDEKPNA